MRIKSLPLEGSDKSSKKKSYRGPLLVILNLLLAVLILLFLKYSFHGHEENQSQLEV